MGVVGGVRNDEVARRCTGRERWPRGHCMLVTLKFRPRTTSPKSGEARERENGKGERNGRSSVL